MKPKPKPKPTSTKNGEKKVIAKTGDNSEPIGKAAFAKDVGRQGVRREAKTNAQVGDCFSRPESPAASPESAPSSSTTPSVSWTLSIITHGVEAPPIPALLYDLIREGHRITFARTVEGEAVR